MEIRINLLPDYRKEEIAKARKYRLVLRLGIALLSIFILFGIFLFSLQKTLEMELKSAETFEETRSNKEKLEKIRKFDNEFKRINSTVEQAVIFEREQLYWSGLIFRLNNRFSEGITITDLATKEFGVVLVGEADNRENLMAYKEKLAEDECFQDINLPLSNLISKEDIVFQMDFKIKKECLKINAK